MPICGISFDLISIAVRKPMAGRFVEKNTMSQGQLRKCDHRALKRDIRSELREILKQEAEMSLYVKAPSSNFGQLNSSH